MTQTHKERKKIQRIRENKNIAKRNAWKNDYRKRDKVCANCKNTKRLEFHHTNYELHQGITLCMHCHRELHKQLKGGART